MAEQRERPEIEGPPNTHVSATHGTSIASCGRFGRNLDCQRRTAARIRRRFRHTRRRMASTMVERRSRRNSHHTDR